MICLFERRTPEAIAKGRQAPKSVSQLSAQKSRHHCRLFLYQTYALKP